MMNEEELEGKIRKAVEELLSFRRENARLKRENETLRSHNTMLNNENAKAQRVLADYERRRHLEEQVTHRVERALEKLDALGTTP